MIHTNEFSPLKENMFNLAIPSKCLETYIDFIVILDFTQSTDFCHPLNFNNFLLRSK
jgi:hypothetical protein